eukprot:gene17326-23634_t
MTTNESAIDMPIASSSPDVLHHEDEMPASESEFPNFDKDDGDLYHGDVQILNEDKETLLRNLRDDLVRGIDTRLDQLRSSSYFSSDQNKGSSFPRERLRPEDLLPRDAANTKWAQANPAGQGDVNDVNLLNAGFHIGVNTQGQSLRNASHDLHSEPSNPRYKVSIWNNSTIEPDMNRKALE